MRVRPDYLGDRAAAGQLRNRIAQFWRERGHNVRVWTDERRLGDERVFVVRSELVNGMPPLASRQLRAAA